MLGLQAPSQGARHQLGLDRNKMLIGRLDFNVEQRHAIIVLFLCDDECDRAKHLLLWLSWGVLLINNDFSLLFPLDPLDSIASYGCIFIF